MCWAESQRLVGTSWAYLWGPKDTQVSLWDLLSAHHFAEFLGVGGG